MVLRTCPDLPDLNICLSTGWEARKILGIRNGLQPDNAFTPLAAGYFLYLYEVSDMSVTHHSQTELHLYPACLPVTG